MADDMGPGGNRSGQGDHSHFNVGGQGVAHRFTAAKQHVDNPLREDIFCQLRQLQRRQRVISEGFITTQLPAASAGASFQAAIISG